MQMHTPHPSAASSPADVKDPGTEEEVIAYVQKCVRDSIDGVNARRLERSDSTFHFVAPDFKQISAQPLDIDEFIRLLKAHCQNYPEFYVRCMDINTDLDMKRNTALVYYNTETTGAPPGVTRPAWSSCEFRKVDGRWQQIWAKTMHGPAHAGFNP
ncbi:hypothetical protein CLAFUW4_11416 [Fulvia fulva]|uniref:SnoaL-like domain-containing protein n=1 Tax=Passalora fulva TaxID=5499 RepID=A0A9Q8PCH4_PASFU|nr:uncharacterized protein CLAFUR5_10459 [Fulvia fulva]KAK4619377.1 hypothetical protein CLAFUR4_11422 [Fulvia fulva]KAK4620555.1 hypothetical protein CLAFUR0_11428 [Fulvia fulva]UJO19897.1 hypothetical protein CLAFUR5_10459 [Fulvia fulva]WPV17482.1 hypothetical protein CLAFUW4_11416 [Fulvia fulva]WPV32007.1 hypothetical protein CLAFUW7_11412 [Fulvia fulva]